MKIILIIYILGGVALFFLQDYILFRPVPLKKDYLYNFTAKHKEINIPVAENSNLNIVQFLPADSLAKGILLYFHGNKKIFPGMRSTHLILLIMVTRFG